MGKYYFVEPLPGGCAFFDYDNDGRPDIFLCQPGRTPGAKVPGSDTAFGGAGPDGPFCKLYHNDGSGHFTDVTHQMGLDVPLNYVQGVAIGDYDNDGYDDLYITAYGGNHLFHNDGGHRFRDVTADAGVGDTDQGIRWSSSAAFGDYDNDGKLDLIVLHYTRWTPESDQTCKDARGQKDYCSQELYPSESYRLYHNDGGGHFTDVSTRTGIARVHGRGLAVIWMDTRHNGSEDLYVANDRTPNLLLQNGPGHVFQDIALKAGVAYDPDGKLISGMGVAAGDMDQSGWESLAVTNFSGIPDVLFQGLPGGRFEDATYRSGVGALTMKTLGFGVAFLDYNRDGYPDLVVGNGHIDPHVALLESGTTYAEPIQLLKNDGQGRFQDAGRDTGDMRMPHVTRGLAVGDFDNDGRLDVLVNNLNGPARLYHNESRDSNHWISIRLEGVRSNRDGAGALVWLTSGGKQQLAECRLSSSYCSSCDRRIYFGLGKGTVEKIEVRWPSGIIQSLPGAPPDRFYWLREGEKLRPDPRNPNPKPGVNLHSGNVEAISQ